MFDWLCKMDRHKQGCRGRYKHTQPFKEDVHFYKDVHKKQQTKNSYTCFLKSLNEGWHYWGHFSLQIFAQQWSRKPQMEHLPPPLSPALGSNCQYNLPGEWIMFVYHCFVNCPPASCAIKPKQNNCQRLLHLCSAPAGRGERYSNSW